MYLGARWANLSIQYAAVPKYCSLCYQTLQTVRTFALRLKRWGLVTASKRPWHLIVNMLWALLQYHNRNNQLSSHISEEIASQKNRGISYKVISHDSIYFWIYYIFFYSYANKRIIVICIIVFPSRLNTWTGASGWWKYRYTFQYLMGQSLFWLYKVHFLRRRCATLMHNK